MNFMSPTSGSGLIEIIVAPLRFAFCSEVSMRGWFVPGFCPITMMQSAASRSASVTVLFPVPSVSLRAAPLDS